MKLHTQYFNEQQHKTNKITKIKWEKTSIKNLDRYRTTIILKNDRTQLISWLSCSNQNYPEIMLVFSNCISVVVRGVTINFNNGAIHTQICSCQSDLQLIIVEFEWSNSIRFSDLPWIQDIFRENFNQCNSERNTC